MTDFLKRERTRHAINRMAMATQEVRRLAVSHRSAVTLCPNYKKARCQGDWNSQLIIFSGRAKSSTSDVVSTYEALEHGHIEWHSFREDNFLEMQSNGLTMAQNGTFIYCPDDNDTRYAHALIVSKSGRTRLAQDFDNDGIKELRKGEPIRCPS